MSRHGPVSERTVTPEDFAAQLLAVQHRLGCCLNIPQFAGKPLQNLKDSPHTGTLIEVILERGVETSLLQLTSPSVTSPTREALIERKAALLGVRCPEVLPELPLPHTSCYLNGSLDAYLRAVRQLGIKVTSQSFGQFKSLPEAPTGAAALQYPLSPSSIVDLVSNSYETPLFRYLDGHLPAGTPPLWKVLSWLLDTAIWAGLNGYQPAVVLEQIRCMIAERLIPLLENGHHLDHQVTFITSTRSRIKDEEFVTVELSQYDGLSISHNYTAFRLYGDEPDNLRYYHVVLAI